MPPGQAEGSSDAAKVSTEKATELLRQLRAATTTWFSSVRSGLEEPYAYEQAQADQARIQELFAALSQELRKTGLDNLLVEESMKNLRGDEVKLAKLPKHLLKEPRDADATSAKMIQQLKDVSSKLGSELDEMHKVAENAWLRSSE